MSKQRRKERRKESILQQFKQVKKMEAELAQLNKSGTRKSGTNWEIDRQREKKKEEIRTLRDQLKKDEVWLQKNFLDDYRDFFEKTTGQGTGIKEKPTADRRVSTAAKQIEDMRKQPPRIQAKQTNYKTAAERRNENERLRVLAKQQKEDRRKQRERKDAAAKAKKPHNRSNRFDRASMLDHKDSREQRRESRDRKAERAAEIKNLRLSKDAEAKAKKATAEAKAKKEAAEKHELYKRNLKKQQNELKRQEELRISRETRQRVEITRQKRLAYKEKAKQQKIKILGKGCDILFGQRSFLYKTFNIDHDPVKLQDLINDIVNGLIEAQEEKNAKRKSEGLNKLADKIFLYILNNSQIKEDQFDELLNDIVMRNSLTKAFFSVIHSIEDDGDKDHDKGEFLFTTGQVDPRFDYTTKFIHDEDSIKIFKALMNELYTNNTRKQDIIRTYLLKQNKAKGKKYLQKATRNTKPGMAKIRATGDGGVLSQSTNQREKRFYLDRSGRQHQGELRGKQVIASSFDPKSLKASQPKPTNSKFFMDMRYGNHKNILHYFLYNGMIRYYEHGFYIPGDDTLHGEQKKSGFKKDLEHTTNIRSGTIKKEGKEETWYSQTPDNQWVWKQSMGGADKPNKDDWEAIKTDFKYNSQYVSLDKKTTNISLAFKKFVENQEKNPRYIIFKGISSHLFESSKKATNKKDPFKFGFIDTERGIELGDYIMFECINNYHETSAKAFREGQQPQYQTPLMFFIHKEHLNPPKDAKEIEDWAKKRSILSEYEYRELFLNKLMDDQYSSLMKDIQSLTDFTTAGKYCEHPNSINKNHTELCYSTGEQDKEGNPIYKSNVIFPKDQFEKMTGEHGILAIQGEVLINFIDGKEKQIEALKNTECTKKGELCFKLIYDTYNEISTFQTETEQEFEGVMKPLEEYIHFLNLSLGLSPENDPLIKDEIEKVETFRRSVSKSFNKQIKSKELKEILKNMFNTNSEKLIEFKEIQEEELKWVSIEKEKAQKETFKLMEKEWTEQKKKFDNSMDKYFNGDLAEVASQLKDKIAERDLVIEKIIEEYNKSSKKAHEEKAEEEARIATEKAEQARLAKEQADLEEAARLKKEAEKKAKEAARLKKETEEKAKKEKEASRKKVLLATLRKWQETYEKEKREEERRVLMEEIRKNYNNAIEHNIKIRKEINDKLEKLGQIEKELLEKNDPDIYTKLIRLGSKWETQILSLKDKGLEDKISQCLKEFTDLLGNVNDLLTKYEDSHLSSYATNIKKIKDELEEKIGRCEDFIKEVKQHHTALLELNENFDDDGKVIADASLMDIHDAILKIDTMINPNHHHGMTMEDVSQEGINEDPVPKLMKPIILELKSKLEEKENTMKDVVTENLKDINNKLIQNKNEMKNILKEYGYNNTPEEEEQNNDKITIMKNVIKLFDTQKEIMQKENNLELSIEDIFKEKFSDEEKIPEDETDGEKQTRMNEIKTNEEELKELEKKRIEKEALEKQLNAQKELLGVNQTVLKTQLETLYNLVDMDAFKKELEVAFKRTGEIFEAVDKIKEKYEGEQGKDLDHGAAKASIEQILKQFENKIIKGSLIKKREDIELIHDILEKNLEKDHVTIEDIEKIMKGSNEEDELSIKLMMVPKLLTNITTFLLEDTVYNKSLLENNKHIAAAEKKNAELEQARLKKEDEIKNRIEKEKQERIESERQAKLKAEQEVARLKEEERLNKLARDKEEYEKDLTEKRNHFEETEQKYKKLLSRYDESRYSKETKDLNDELMEMIFKSGLLHSDQTYQEEDKEGHRQGVEDWFDTTGEGGKMKEDNISYGKKLEKYNEAMKKTNEIFG